MKPIFHGKANQGGVYKITNLKNGRIYIGSTTRFKGRYSDHFNGLENKRHANLFLQHDYTKSGSEHFLFEVIEVVEDKEQRIKREQHFIDQFYDSQKQCYNLRKDAADSRSGTKNVLQANPLTDKRCKSPSPEIKEKRIRKLKEAYQEFPELREQCSIRAKRIRWGGYSANVTVMNKTTGEIVTINGSIREFCEKQSLSYKAFHQLVRGKIKSSGGWYLGTALPEYAERKGEKRKPLSKEHREKISGGKFVGIELIHKEKGKLIVEANIKEQCRELKLPYTTFLKVLKGTCGSVHGWGLTNPWAFYPSPDVQDQNTMTTETLDVVIPCPMKKLTINDLVIPDSLVLDYVDLAEIEEHEPRTEHRKTMEEVRATGKTYVLFYSDEVESKLELIKSMVEVRASSARLNKLNARDLIVDCTISKQEEKNFFNQHHVSGFTNSAKCFGLRNQESNELVCLVSLRRPIQHKGKIEIARFATRMNTLVRGGFSKLLKSAIIPWCKDNCFASIISYAELRFGEGGVYKTCGFRVIKDNTGENYWYTDGEERMHRFKFRAQPGKSENEVAKEHGVYRVYGCGNRLYELSDI